MLSRRRCKCPGSFFSSSVCPSNPQRYWGFGVGWEGVEARHARMRLRIWQLQGLDPTQRPSTPEKRLGHGSEPGRKDFPAQAWELGPGSGLCMGHRSQPEYTAAGSAEESQLTPWVALPHRQGIFLGGICWPKCLMGEGGTPRVGNRPSYYKS